jgi:hypothetical protein
MALAACIMAGAPIIKIVCESIVEDRKDARSQRFKIILKRKAKDQHGQEYEEEITFEFGSEAEMVKMAHKCQEVCHAPIERITS